MILFDCRQGWTVKDYRVPGWHSQTVLNPVPFDEILTKQAAEAHPTDQLVILDYEEWVLPKEINKFIQVVDWWRDVRPELRIGYYDVFPGNAYWPSISGGNQKKEWQRYNASISRTQQNGKWISRGLIDVVDFIVPCLYSYYPNGGGWDHESLWFSHYAPATIEASRAYQKQVYPFIWQRIFNAETGDTSLTVSDEHFRKQLQFCIDNADGICIWDWADETTGNDVLARTSRIMDEFV